MNEIDILNVFYDQMKARGATRDKVFISIDEEVVGLLTYKLKDVVDLKTVQGLADICIANEWLERTTADTHYKYLSLTEAGLQTVLLNKYL